MILAVYQVVPKAKLFQKLEELQPWNIMWNLNKKDSVQKRVIFIGDGHLEAFGMVETFVFDVVI